MASRLICCSGDSVKDKFDRSVHADLLASELTGTVSKNDYLAMSHLVLNDFQINDPTDGVFDSSGYLHLENVDRMLEPGYLALEHGYVRHSNGSWYVACYTELGTNCNGEMIDWWFRHCDNTERYKWWHPKDHIKGDWNPQYYSIQPKDRKKRHYLNNVHQVIENVGGNEQRLFIEFERPSKYFTISQFKKANVTACICARVHADDPVIGVVAVGHLVHMVREINGKNELRSRFWLGNIHKNDNHPYLPSAVINYIGNTTIFRYLKAPTSLAKGLWIHCAEEMACLNNFLPYFYVDFYKNEIKCSSSSSDIIPRRSMRNKTMALLKSVKSTSTKGSADEIVVSLDGNSDDSISNDDDDDVDDSSHDESKDYTESI